MVIIIKFKNKIVLNAKIIVWNATIINVFNATINIIYKEKIV